ncbi:MKI67 FHA domain-interacting nucleolar phosphoprotein-like [Caerostris extrusa]|uniref:MKI67 FHA domain-interacting nucleolar phosphoprotein-like n=1 Tax=Caerostris extrusa TaxID=172846 RepID=A0AAV4U1J6_CAEEX|nr:MKI67 FHA domain-interacting nucleolar phosphoprotein-like [Caerostris extrusa]
MMNTFVENVRRKIEAKTPTKKTDGKPKKPKHPKKKIVDDDTGPGVVYIGHIPHGFYEKEMKKYFSQFGKINRLRLARSRKTGKCKGFAYIEFKSEAVAKIAAEAMNNYLFFEKILKCEFVPANELHPNAFDGWKGKILSSARNRMKQNSVKSEEDLIKSKNRRLKKLIKLKSYLKEKDIDFKVKSFIPLDDK